jgi:hypothetical protein
MRRTPFIVMRSLSTTSSCVSSSYTHKSDTYNTDHTSDAISVIDLSMGERCVRITSEYHRIMMNRLRC